MTALRGRVIASEQRLGQLAQLLPARLEQVAANVDSLAALTETDSAPARLAGQLDQLANTGAMLESKLKGLEFVLAGKQEQEQQAVGIAARLVASQRALQDAQMQLQQVQAQAQHATAAFDTERIQLQHDAAAATQVADAVQAQLQELHNRLAAIQAVGEQERVQAAAEREALLQQAQARVESAEAGARMAASQQLAELEYRKRKAEADLAALHGEFKQYQLQKEQEVRLLEGQLLQAVADSEAAGWLQDGDWGAGGERAREPLRQSAPSAARLQQRQQGRRAPAASSTSKVATLLRKTASRTLRLSVSGSSSQQEGRRARSASPPSSRHNTSAQLPYLLSPSHLHMAPSAASTGTASAAAPTGLAAEVAAARAADSITASLREIHLERMTRHKAEAVAEELRSTVARLKDKLKQCQAEMTLLKESAAASAAAALQHADSREQLDAVRGELAACQAVLRAAKADSARRQRALQQAGLEDPLPGGQAAVQLQGSLIKVGAAAACGSC